MTCTQSFKQKSRIVLFFCYYFIHFSAFYLWSDKTTFHSMIFSWNSPKYSISISPSFCLPGWLTHSVIQLFNETILSISQVSYPTLGAESEEVLCWGCSLPPCLITSGNTQFLGHGQCEPAVRTLIYLHVLGSIALAMLGFMAMCTKCPPIFLMKHSVEIWGASTKEKKIVLFTCRAKLFYWWYHTFVKYYKLKFTKAFSNELAGFSLSKSEC